ncbi:hypothetical protein Godav_018210 [Gossypium davidsonii]|uniref:Uncharacterized protein n=2 Tax=Gossypium TaxID=3633 RepID=A0A7J8QVU3_GOSDV|nr:hypothetical protein [Gossypium davidsonii]MBA0640591.1 hypothetical protein [Gossypium klotzschianum]
MYADRVEEGAGKRSVKERLNGNSAGNFIPRRQIAGKRQRQDDKWEHDLYQEDGPNVSNRKVDARDLRLKLRRKSLQNVSQSGRGTLSGVRDLREKLSGTMNAQPINADPRKQKVKAAQPARKSVVVETPELDPRRAANTPARKKAKQSVSNLCTFLLFSIFPYMLYVCVYLFVYMTSMIHETSVLSSLFLLS